MCAALASIQAKEGTGKNWAAAGSINNMRGQESVNSEFKMNYHIV